MGLLDWVYAVLYYFGFWRKSATVVFLGLDNAGKTTLLYKLKDGTLASFVPTQRAQAQEMQLGALTVRAWDLGGHEAVRELWRDYYLQADAILFMVDSADVERFGEARDELAALMDDPALRAVPVAVLANKKDLPGSVAMEVLVQELDLQRFLGTESRRPFAIFGTSVVDGTGYLDVFQWLATLV